MQIFKKTIIASFVLGSSLVFSGTMGPVCTPGNVTVPCQATAWDVGVQALYLKSTFSNTTNGGTGYNTNNVGSSSGTRIYKELERDFKWGFKLEGSYHFNTGNDINVNWYYWKDNNAGTLTNPPTGLVGGGTGSATLSGTSRFNAVNAELGQHIDLSRSSTLRLHAGVQYAQLHLTQEQNLITTGAPLIEGVDINGTASMGIVNKFNGVGPRLGADMSYLIGNGFALYGNAAGAALIGTQKYYDTVVNPTAFGVSHPVYSSYLSGVPEVEAKLGGKYTYNMRQGNLTLDVGYMFTEYFDISHSSDLLILSNGIDAVEYKSNQNFTLYGPYVGLKWVG